MQSATDPDGPQEHARRHEQHGDHLVRRLGGVAAIALVLGAIGIVAILLAVYGVGCFQLRRPSRESSAVAAPARMVSPETSVDPSPIVAADATSDAARAAVEPSPAVVVLAGTVVDVQDASNARTPAKDVEVRGRLGFLSNEAGVGPVRTSADGTFRIELADPGKRPLTFWLFAEAGGSLRAASAKVFVDSGGHGALDILLERFPNGDLVGTTVDPDDRPIPAVRVTIGADDAKRDTLSDERGNFRFSDVHEVGSLDAARDGYTLVVAKQPQAIHEGGYEPARVVLAATARLYVRVVNEQGRGLAGYILSPSLSAWEKDGPHRGLAFESRGDRRVKTDEDGHAILEVWSGLRISIEVESSSKTIDSGREIYEREDQGVLIPRAGTEGRPIVLRAGEEREVRTIVASGIVLRGHVVDESGQPIEKAFVQLEGPRDAAGEQLKRSCECDELGAFGFEIPRSTRVPVVRIRASDRIFFLSSRGARTAVLDVDLRTELKPDLVMQLRAGLRIAGRVLAPDETGVSAGVVARATVGPLEDLEPRSSMTTTSRDGSFVLEGLEPGPYELHVQPFQTYRDMDAGTVAAGTEGLRIRLESKRLAHLTIEAMARDGNLKKWILLNGRTRPRRGATPEAPLLPAEAEYDEPGHWPRGVVGMYYGSGGFSDENGSTPYALVPEKEASTQLDLDEGFYWLGAKGTDEEGRNLFPVGTGFVRVEAGEHKLRFVLAPSAPVDGRLIGGDVIDLRVGIARRGGRLFELDAGGDQLWPSRPVGAGGAFSFAEVPVGQNEIWIGTASELADGKPSHRQPLTVDAKGVPFLEIPIR